MARKTALIFFIVVMLLVTGCWNRRELNELAIAVAMGLDKTGNQYKLSMQVVDPGQVAAKKGAGTRTPVTLYEATGRTVFEALRKLTTLSPRKMYSSHLRMLVLDETLAKEGIGESLDFISRDHEMRTDFFIVVAKNTSASNVLKILTHLESIPANFMFSSLESSQKSWAPTLTVTLDELINNLVSEGQHPVITGIRIIGPQKEGESKMNVEQIDSPSYLQYTGLAVFRKDKLIGWLNETESKAYNYIRDKVKSTAGHLTCPDGGKLTVEVIRSKTKVSGSVNKNTPQIRVDVRSEVNVGEVGCHIDLTKSKTIAELEKIGGDRVRRFIEETIRAVQKKYKVDIFGFGEVIHRSAPAAWSSLKEDWDRHFAKMPVKVNVEIIIRRLGTVSNSFLEEMKKTKKE